MANAPFRHRDLANWRRCRVVAAVLVVLLLMLAVGMAAAGLRDLWTLVNLFAQTHESGASTRH